MCQVNIPYVDPLGMGKETVFIVQIVDFNNLKRFCASSKWCVCQVLCFPDVSRSRLVINVYCNSNMTEKTKETIRT